MAVVDPGQMQHVLGLDGNHLRVEINGHLVGFAKGALNNNDGTITINRMVLRKLDLMEIPCDPTLGFLGCVFDIDDISGVRFARGIVRIAKFTMGFEDAAFARV